MTRAFTKAKPVIDKEENGVTPKFYIRCLVELEDFITDVSIYIFVNILILKTLSFNLILKEKFHLQCWEDKEGRKNMSKNNSKSLATLRQKLRKYNKDFEADIINYRANPEAEDEEKDEEEEAGKYILIISLLS